MSVVYGLRVVSALSCWSALCLRSRLATLAQVRSSCPLMSVDVSFSLRLMVWKKSLRQCGALSLLSRTTALPPRGLKCPVSLLMRDAATAGERCVLARLAALLQMGEWHAIYGVRFATSSETGWAVSRDGQGLPTWLYMGVSACR